MGNLECGTGSHRKHHLSRDFQRTLDKQPEREYCSPESGKAWGKHSICGLTNRLIDSDTNWRSLKMTTLWTRKVNQKERGPETASLDTQSILTKGNLGRPGPAPSCWELWSEEHWPHQMGDSAVRCEIAFVPYIQILPESDRQTDIGKERGRIEKNKLLIFGSVIFKNILLKPKTQRHPEAG